VLYIFLWNENETVGNGWIYLIVYKVKLGNDLPVTSRERVSKQLFKLFKFQNIKLFIKFDVTKPKFFLKNFLKKLQKLVIYCLLTKVILYVVNHKYDWLKRVNCDVSFIKINNKLVLNVFTNVIYRGVFIKKGLVK
jgi:hypothetical protein